VGQLLQVACLGCQAGALLLRQHSVTGKRVTLAGQMLVLLSPHELLKSCQGHILQCFNRTTCRVQHVHLLLLLLGLLLLWLPGLARCLLLALCCSGGSACKGTFTLATAAASSRAVCCQQQCKW
jgi:hypothetical protein